MELQKDLHSLKLLYELLLTTATDIEEGARILFKNLLDSARDDLLLASSKVIAIGPATPSISSNASDSVKPDQNLSRKPFPPQAFSEQNRKKRCKICQQSNVQKPASEEIAKDFSRHVSDSIKLIDSTILSLQLSSDLSTPVKHLSLEEPALANWTENSSRNEPPAYHYVHGLRIPSIRDNNVIELSRKTVTNDSLALPNNSIGNLVKPRSFIRTPIDCASTAYSHSQKGLKPMLLDYKSSMKMPCARQYQKPTSPYRQESESSSSSSQGSAVSSPTTSYNSRSQLETETSSATPESSPEESIGNSTDYSVESYSESSGNKNRKKSDKPIGRFRRLKNKLGLIFHHHHHHHHRENGAKEKRTSAWNHLGTIFHHKDKEREYEKKAVEKLKKQPVSKKQVKQFQALMKGMVRHVKQSKKPKVAKGRRQAHHSNRHWWQLFKVHRRRGVKLPSGGRLRLKVKPKKPLLKGPKLVR